ncbi:MAG: hypothetical protein ABEJ67_05330 [Halanaeroarchaeum sp.]
MVWIIDNLVEALSLFGQVATNDPVAPVLLLFSAGVLLTALSVFGVLSLGGILSALAVE